ncbi:MAG TPA: hypothetical protein PKN48_02065 [Bacteroidales bacterium]|nr:hypothetical protein [Bacteroidales bacterium]
MAISEKDLLLALSNEEPQYLEILAKLDEKAIAYLSTLSKAKDVMLATKAIYLAGLYSKPSGHAIVESAAKSTVLLKRIASASVLEHMPEEKRDMIAEKLIDDADISLQKLVIKATGSSKSVKLKAKFAKLSKDSSSKFIRDLIKERQKP